MTATNDLDRQRIARDLIYRVTPYNLEVADALARDILQALAGTADVFDEARAERARAHAKHGDTSMESMPADDPTGRRYRILVEEVGEVAQEFNDAEHDGRSVDLAALRKELIQVAAMAGAWADACTPAAVSEEPHHEEPHHVYCHTYLDGPCTCHRPCACGSEATR